MSAVSVSEPGVRPILADAVDVARRALLALEPAGVGAHLGVAAEDDNAATHRFEATLRGYRGWQWAVVVAAPPGADYATVSESALLPGPEALVAPDFVPWERRVRPGDLAPGDLLAPPAGDPRLVPGYIATGDPVVDEVALDIGLGRTKVLSLEGREEAAERWYTTYGPDTEMARAAPSTCGLCGFYVPLAGALRAAFGVCGNAMGADGHVVHTEYGCGAHSDVEAPTGGGSPLYEAYDDAAYDVVSVEPSRARSANEDGDVSSGANASGDVVVSDTAPGDSPSTGSASVSSDITATEGAETSADSASAVVSSPSGFAPSTEAAAATGVAPATDVVPSADVEPSPEAESSDTTSTETVRTDNGEIASAVDDSSGDTGARSTQDAAPGDLSGAGGSADPGRQRSEAGEESADDVALEADSSRFHSSPQS
ncbi:DUF3027 domain-containing protein [Nocardia noduli]|uniref:DUF3027 domain-containing protein n=1 Tax=Nocardia noduli TaxID=2815722 RepID=UPI0027DFC66A|nr:DUF3027 domain-containing protein [Nocardia noduli]